VLDDEEVREEIEDMRIGDRIDSDHFPVEVRVKGRKKRRMIEKKDKKEWREIWDEEGRKDFVQRRECEGGRNEGIDEQWKRMEKRLKRATEK